MDKLQDEYFALRSSGYSGEGFHSDGTRVGIGVSHDVPMHLARDLALKKAEERQRLGQLMGTAGGQRLGGVKQKLGKSPRELAAEVSFNLS